jgi:hypothetical protein
VKQPSALTFKLVHRLSESPATLTTERQGDSRADRKADPNPLIRALRRIQRQMMRSLSWFLPWMPRLPTRKLYVS